MAATEEDGPDYRSRGLMQKYAVYRLKPCPSFADGTCENQLHTMHHFVDGVWQYESPVTEQVFVLKPESDPIARVALRRYAQRAWAGGLRPLANDIHEWLKSITDPARPPEALDAKAELRALEKERLDATAANLRFVENMTRPIEKPAPRQPEDHKRKKY